MNDDWGYVFEPCLISGISSDEMCSITQHKMIKRDFLFK